MYFLFFLFFSNFAIFFGLVLIFFQNPMYSILSLVGCVLCSSILLFMFGFEFLPFVYLVVYIGAIAILFLFVIMMLNINTINSFTLNSSSIEFFFYFCVFFLKVFFLFFFFNHSSILFYLDYLQSSVCTLYFYGYIQVEFQHLFVDSLSDLLISGLHSKSEFAAFCCLYNIYIFAFVLAGFILLFAMLGSISLCLTF